MTEKKQHRPLPSQAELAREMEKLAAQLFPGDGDECDFLNENLNHLWDELDEATSDAEKRRIVAQIRAVETQMKARHCLPH